MVLVATGGKLSFWILPNLDSEKTGFFDSFTPLHSAEWAKPKKKSKKKVQKQEVAENGRESGMENEAGDEPQNGTEPEGGIKDPGTVQSDTAEPQSGIVT